MKTPKFYALIGTLVLAMIFVSCSKDDAETPFYSAPSTNNSKTLSEFEQEGLISILEMQKLHRDVYQVIAQNIDAPAFDDLYQRDAKLLELLSIKVDKYGLVNPTQDKKEGEFANSAIQYKFDEFVRSTNSGVLTMLNFAKQMEQDMIDAIESQKSTLSGNPDIARIYEDMAVESAQQLDVLVDEWDNIINISAPKDEHKED